MVHQKQNFLTDEECDTLLNLHQHINYFPLKRMHRDTQLVDISNYLAMSRLELADDLYFDFLRYIESKITNHIKQFDEGAYINYWECVKWQQGSSQDAHKDLEIHPWTSIIYLNDNYAGGETFVGTVDLQQIVPHKGKIITFEGATTLHGVTEITKGTRYTVPIWYRSVA